MLNTGWAEPGVIVAIYAAIVATIALTWNVAVFIINRKKKLSIFYRFLYSLKEFSLGQSKFFTFLSVEITNIGREEIHLKRANIILCGKNLKALNIYEAALNDISKGSKIKYPYSLKHGELVTTEFWIEELLAIIGNLINDNDKLCVQVHDTLNKKYYSGKFCYHELKGAFEAANEVNKRKNK